MRFVRIDGSVSIENILNHLLHDMANKSDIMRIAMVNSFGGSGKMHWGRNGSPFFFEANIRGFEFFFFFLNESPRFSRQHVDKGVFLNDRNCCWQSIFFGKN